MQTLNYETMLEKAEHTSTRTATQARTHTRARTHTHTHHIPQYLCLLIDTEPPRAVNVFGLRRDPFPKSSGD